MAKIALILLAVIFCSERSLTAHCQMPCGIYHDNMVYDQIDQYIETMYKATTMLDDLKLDTPKDRNNYVRWVIMKEDQSNNLSELITQYFLQQKIKPGEKDTPNQIASLHKMLFLIVQIKQNADRNLVNQFAEEWTRFKKMFHAEDYECQINKIKQRLQEQEEKQEKSDHDAKHTDKKETVDAHHYHDHDHDHDHHH